MWAPNMQATQPGAYQVQPIRIELELQGGIIELEGTWVWALHASDPTRSILNTSTEAELELELDWD